MFAKVKKENILPAGWLIAGFIWNIWYQVVRGQAMLDSDMSSEMVLSDILNKEHSLSGVTTNWFYSTEIKCLHMQWLYRIGLALFPSNWHIARTFSMFIALILLAFGVWLLFYAAGYSKQGIWAAAFTLLPGGSWYFWQTLYGGYYLPYIYIMLFTMSLSLMAVRNLRSIRSAVYLVIVALLGLGSGLNGIKQLMVFYVPFVLSLSVMFVMHIREHASEKTDVRKLFSDNCFKLLCISIVSTLFSVVGYIINSKILSARYFFQQYDETKIGRGSFLEFLKQYIWSFGFADNKLLMSGQGIASMCGVVFGIIVVCAGVFTVLRLPKLSYGLRYIAAFSVIAITFNCFIFSYVGGEIQYFQSLVPLGYFLLVIMVNALDFKLEVSRKVVINALMVILLITSLGTVYNESNEPFHDYRAKQNLNPVVKQLESMGYTDGISTFWTANVVTELSDGTIDMWTVSPFSPTDWYIWLQRRDHMERFPEGRYFYLYDNEEEDKMEINMAFLGNHPELVPIYADEKYTVYGN